MASEGSIIINEAKITLSMAILEMGGDKDQILLQIGYVKEHNTINIDLRDKQVLRTDSLSC